MENMSTSPLDILCEVAADAESVQTLPPIRTNPENNSTTLPPLGAPQFRLSSSAPSHQGFLSNPTLPIEPPPNYQKAYYMGDSSMSNPSALHNHSVSYPHAILNAPRQQQHQQHHQHHSRHHQHPHQLPQPHQPQHQPLPRNLSAPSLGDRIHHVAVPHQTVIMDESYHIRRTPSQNIPVPYRLSGVMPPQGLSPPVYGSPTSSNMSRLRASPYVGSPLKSAGGRTSKTSGRRDSYTRFTAEEEAMLMEGVRVYGVGNWKKILNSYRFHWKRTAVDLKDKYRNMSRAKQRRLNASSQSDLSSVGSDDGRGVQAMSPLQAEMVSKTIGLRISPVSTANNTPSGSVEERDKIMRATRL